MLRDKSVSCQPAPTKSPSANGDGKAHRNSRPTPDGNGQAHGDGKPASNSKPNPANHLAPEESANGQVHAVGPMDDRLPAPSQTGQSVRAILMNAPKLSEEDWKAFKAKELARTPAKRRPLVRYLLFRCMRKAVCWVSDSSIANELGYCERTVRDYLSEIEEVGIVSRQAVATTFRRAIFFPSHLEYENTITRVKQSGKICRARPAKSAVLGRQNLPRKPFTVEDGKLETNSRGRDERPETNTALEDGGTGGLKFSHSGTVNGKTGGPLAPLAQEAAPLPTVGLGIAPLLEGRAAARDAPREARATTPDRSPVPAASPLLARPGAFDPQRWSIEQRRRIAAAEPVFQAGDEMEIVRQLSSLAPGSTEAEVRRVARAVSVLLDDRHSEKNWRVVADLARFKKVPLEAFSDIAGTDKPAAVVMHRLKPVLDAEKAENAARKRRHARTRGSAQ